MTLSASDKAYVRAVGSTALPDVVTIERLKLQDDTAGGQTETWEVAYTDVPARFAEQSGREGMMAARESVETKWILTVPYDQDITEKDRIVHDGQRFEVQFVNSGRSYDTVRRCLMARIA